MASRFSMATLKWTNGAAKPWRGMGIGGSRRSTSTIPVVPNAGPPFARFLTDRGVALTEAGRSSFLSAVAREFRQATETMERRARGDWSKDKHLDHLAPFEPLAARSIAGNAKVGTMASSASVSPSASASQVFEAYWPISEPNARCELCHGLDHWGVLECDYSTRQF
jgi:hypothetical protein